MSTYYSGSKYSLNGWNGPFSGLMPLSSLYYFYTGDVFDFDVRFAYFFKDCSEDSLIAGIRKARNLRGVIFEFVKALFSSESMGRDSTASETPRISPFELSELKLLA